MRMPLRKPLLLENKAGDVVVSSTARCIWDAVAGQLSKLEITRSNCVSNLGFRENIARSLLTLLTIFCVLGIALQLPLQVMVQYLIGTICLVFIIFAPGSSNPDQYRQVFRISSKLAVLLESQNDADMNAITRGTLERLERAAVAAANPQSMHYHSRLAIAALKTLKRVGDAKTLTQISELLSELLRVQRHSAEQVRVLDALVECINGIKGRIYRQARNSLLLLPS